MATSNSQNHKLLCMPSFSMATLSFVLLMVLCQPCAARKDPGGAPSGVHLRRCKLCLLVGLPVAAVVVAAAAVTLLICVLRRRNRKSTVAVAAVHNGGCDQSSLSTAGVVDKGYNNPSGSAGDSSWRVKRDNPMSINPTMVRSPNPSWGLFRASPPTVHASPSPSHASSTSHRPAARAGSPLRRPGLPVPGRAKQEEKAVTGDPLAMYTPSASAPLKEFDYEQLQVATNNFGRKSLLGRRGGPWVVFKGSKFVKDEGLPATVAIKRFRTTFSEEQCKRIRGELTAKFTLRHKNLVSLLGYSLGKGRFHLVYDYMTNGSLEQHLFRDANGGRPGLSWSLRHSIVKDIAQGLYQPHVTNTPHRSIRASSIMLDHDSTAHLDDHFPYRPERTGSGGSPRASPAVVSDDDDALQADIADLGAVVLELVSGRRHTAAVVVRNAATAPQLVDWVWALHGEGCLLQAVDAALEGEFNRGQASKLLLLGLACSHPDPKLRPKIHDVRMVLLDMKPTPEVPSSKPASN